MKTILRIIATAVILGALAYWVAAGAQRGWSKTSVPVKIVDEVTGIEGVTYHKKFVPGVDFVGAAVIVSAVIAGTSFLFRTKPTAQTSNEKAANSSL